MISSNHGRRVFALEIAGLEYRYHSNKPPSSSSLDSEIATNINYIDIESIVSIGSINADLDPSGGIANYGSTTVTLSINRKSGLGDAGVIFGRCGMRSALTRAKLSASATRDDTVINVSTNLSGLSYPRLLHIGGETIRASSANSTSVTCTRGAGNTPIQTHSIDLEGSIVPEITTEITTFRGRRARLYAAHRYASGETSSYMQVVNGFIDSTPTIEGEEVTISLLPLTALIDTDLSEKGIAQTRLLQGFHFYDGRYGSILEYALGLSQDQDNNEPTLTPDTSATITANTFQTTVLQRRAFNAMFDDFDTSLPKGPTADNYPREHPRYPKLRRAQDAVFVEAGVYPSTLSFNSSNVGYDVIADGSISSALNATRITGSESLRIRLPLYELKQHQLGNNEVKKWPDVINDTLTTLGPSSTAGISGGFGSWRINADNELVFDKLSNSPFTAVLILWNNSYLWRSIRRGLGDQLGVLPPLKWGNFGTNFELDDLSRISYPIDLGTADDPIEQQFGAGEGWRKLEISSSLNSTSSIRQIRDIPLAYYQQFESGILVESSLGLPNSSTAGVYHYITVEFFDHKLQEIRRQIFKCTHETSASFGGSIVGYIIHISNDHEFQDTFSFGDWSDTERALIYRGGGAEGERPSVILLRLLQSGGGGGINGAYDLLSVGLNINSSNIDESSFLAIDGSSTFTLDGAFAGNGSNLRDTFESILKLLGAVIVMKRDEATGVSKLTLVAIGNERASSSDLTIEAGEWFANPPPKWGVYEDIVTQIKYEFDYSPSEDKYLNEVIFNNYSAINRYGGERAKITISLAGVNSSQFGRGAGDNFSYFLPVSARLFNLLSNPLRTWSGQIGTGKSIFIDVGSYIKVSSPHLKGYGDEYGVTDGVGMVRAIRQELLNEGCEIELITTGLTAVNWNSAALVLSHTSNTVTVDSNKYSEAPQTDASFFKTGDIVDYLPAGNHDNAIIGLTIESVLSNVITFTAAHNITVNGGTIEPTAFTNASTLHRIDAYLANSSDILDTSTPAKDFS